MLVITLADTRLCIPRKRNTRSRIPCCRTPVHALVAFGSAKKSRLACPAPRRNARIRDENGGKQCKAPFLTWSGDGNGARGERGGGRSIAEEDPCSREGDENRAHLALYQIWVNVTRSIIPLCAETTAQNANGRSRLRRNGGRGRTKSSKKTLKPR